MPRLTLSTRENYDLDILVTRLCSLWDSSQRSGLILWQPSPSTIDIANLSWFSKIYRYNHEADALVYNLLQDARTTLR